MKKDEDTRLVEVFVGSPWEAELVKGLLESNGINSVLKDGELAPIIPPNSESVQVNENDYEAAMEVVRARETGEAPEPDYL